MNARPLKSSRKGKGCLLVALTIAFVIASGFYFLTAGIRDAKHIEHTLIDRFGWVEDYTPPLDGSLDPQRINAFIRVREAVQGDCADFQAILLSVKGLEELEAKGNESASSAASTGLQGLKSAFGAGPKMVKFSTTRNRALLDEGMGLGEYFHFYLTTYGRQLAKESASDFSNAEEAYVSERALKEYAQILNNHLHALEASEQQYSQSELIARLRAEVNALSDGSHTSPWPEGPVGKTRESLTPYLDHLDRLYCPGIVKVELLQKNRGFQLEG